ncbi:MAG: hypothetical protein HZB65_00890 [Candidatus Aenigmarchaeota archaeon]|nr:hypothetical protein [Candidatus Aenigmarchaeota archaeon]
MLFTKKCELCKIDVKNPIDRKVPVVGYTTLQKRHFCSNEHADLFEHQMKEILKNHIPGSRTCYNC